MEKAIKAQIEAFAILAQIEGMKAANANRAQMGESMAYPCSSFDECASRLFDLAASL